MAESKYEKYVCRRQAVIAGVGPQGLIYEVPKTNKIPAKSNLNTGPRVIKFSKDFVKDTITGLEYGFIMGNTIVGDGKDFRAHKHDFAEIFLFLGTNPNDTGYLGAELEFWLGEGEELEKIKLNTSSGIYVPPGVGHFPLVCRNVESPILMMVIAPNAVTKSVPVIR